MIDTSNSDSNTNQQSHISFHNETSNDTCTFDSIYQSEQISTVDSSELDAVYVHDLPAPVPSVHSIDITQINTYNHFDTPIPVTSQSISTDIQATPDTDVFPLINSFKHSQFNEFEQIIDVAFEQSSEQYEYIINTHNTQPATQTT